jgi:hypothetical protein
VIRELNECSMRLDIEYESGFFPDLQVRDIRPVLVKY